nr:hypothetical protein [Patescibacteria group bacterium]
MPWIKRWWYILPPFLLLFVEFFHHITAFDQDLGRHVLTGKIILQTLHVPTTNLFSYTYPAFPFINHHWGSEVVFYLVFHTTGSLGLFTLSLLIILAAFFLQLRGTKSSPPIIIVPLAIMYLRILSERTDIRPELFSFFFLSLIVTILYRNREHTTRLIYLLIPLELLWTNMHIYFPIGVLVTALFLIEEIILKRKNLRNRHTLTLGAVFLAMGGMTLINPHFLTGALYPFRVFQNYGYTIEENQSPFFLQSLGFATPTFPYLEVTIIILFLSLLFTIRKSRIIDWLLSLTFTLIALMAVRNFPLFVFTTFIACCTASSNLLSALPKIRGKPFWKITWILLISFFLLWQTHSILRKE